MSPVQFWEGPPWNPRGRGHPAPSFIIQGRKCGARRRGGRVLRKLPVLGSGGKSDLRNRHAPPRLLELAPAAFRIEPAFLRFSGGPRFPAGRNGFRRFPDQCDQTNLRVLAVPLLRSEPPGLDDQHPCDAHPPPRQPDEALPHVIGQRPGIPDIEPELDRRRHLVDVLPPGPRGPTEPFQDLAFVEGDRFGHADHGFILAHGSFMMKA